MCLCITPFAFNHVPGSAHVCLCCTVSSIIRTSGGRPIAYWCNRWCHHTWPWLCCMLLSLSVCSAYYVHAYWWHWLIRVIREEHSSCTECKGTQRQTRPDTHIEQRPQMWYQNEALNAPNANMATQVWLAQVWSSKRSLNSCVESAESHISGTTKVTDM